MQRWIPLYWPDSTDSLGWLKGSPVNCLVVNDATKKVQGFDVVAMNDLDSQVAAVRRAKWPRVPAARGQSGGVATGPTGAPWVDSNGWISSLEHAKTPGKPVWIVADPPKDSGMLRSEAYTLAVADAAVYGSRWLISLDADLRHGCAAGNSEALLTWRKIGDATRFFEEHKAWRSLQPVAKLGVLSDFAGPNEALAGEVLNLCNRRYLPFRIVESASADSKSLSGLKAVLLIQLREPESKVQQLLGEFMRDGGLVIAPPSVAHLAGSLKPAGSFENSYDYFSHGEGRVAIARKPWVDPYQVATDAHLLMSRKHDVIRLWNAGSTNAY